MLQQTVPDDYVVATGETHTVEEFVEVAFNTVGLDWHDHVEIDPTFYRPAEVQILLGDASKAKEKLGWAPAPPFSISYAKWSGQTAKDSVSRCPRRLPSQLPALRSKIMPAPADCSFWENWRTSDSRRF